MNYSAPFTARVEAETQATLETWHEQPEAKALLARVDMLERMSDQLAGREGLVSVLTGIADDLAEAENRLYDLRYAVIDEAIASWPGEVTCYLEDKFCERALSVSKAIEAARKAKLATVKLEMAA